MPKRYRLKMRELSPPVVDNLKLIITLHADDGGNVLTYDMEEATQLENWTNPYTSAVQQCWRQILPAYDRFRVFFRPEADGSRYEIVVEYGRTDKYVALGNSGGGPSLKPYTAAVYRGATGSESLVTTITAPDPTLTESPVINKQMWLTRWRWQTAERPVVRNAAQLLAVGSIVPPYVSGISGEASPGTLGAHKTLETTGWLRHWPTTGDTNGRGILPTWHAAYLLGDGTMEQSILRYSEGSNSFPICIRDGSSDTPWNWANHLNATFGGNQAVSAEPLSCQAFAADFGITMDTAHAADGAYLAFLMTGDAYHLEGAQFIANWLLGYDPTPEGGLVKNALNGQQTRGAAWALMRLVHAWKATAYAASLGSTIPSWCQSVSYWEGRMDANKNDFQTTFVDATSPNKISVFHSATAGSSFSTWQEAFLAAGALMAWYYGRTNWSTFATWKMDAVIKRYNNTSGWPRSYPFPVVGGEGYMKQDSWLAPTDTYAELAAAQWEPIVPTGDGNLPAGVFDYHYLSFDRGVLALAAGLGVSGAQACFDYIDPQMTSASYTKLARWSFDA